MSIKTPSRKFENQYYPWFDKSLPDVMQYYDDLQSNAKKGDGEAGALRARRLLAQTDLFFLLVHVLKRPDAIRQWVLSRCREYQSSPYERLDMWARGHYKAIWTNEDVLTTAGWKKHGHLIVGDFVFSPSGKPVKVLARTQVWDDCDCYDVVFDDGTVIKSSFNHLWEVDVQDRSRIKGTDKRVGWKTEVMNTLDLLGQVQEKEKYKTRRWPRIRTCDPIDFNTDVQQKLEINPYILGAWLGNGTSCEPMICHGLKDADAFMELLKKHEPNVRRTDRKNAAYFHIGSGFSGRKGSSDFTESLKKLDLINNKHIPREYFTASIEDRMLLLHGLMDTDGSCNKVCGQSIYCCADETLSADVYELCLGLGKKAVLGKRDTIYKNEPYVFWQITFTSDPDFPEFSLKRKLDCIKGSQSISKFRRVVGVNKIDPVPVSCIQVDSADGLYLAGKNLVPTHNSTIITFASTILEIINDPEITIGLFSHTRPIAKAFLRQIKGECERNDELYALFPHVFWQNPRGESPKWNEDEGIVFKRKGNPKESTIEAWGLVDGQPTSKHFNILHYDDIVTKESINTSEQIKKTTEAWQNSISLGSEGCLHKYVGTRWHLFDTYVEIKKTGIRERVHAATPDGTEATIDNPVLFTPEQLREKRKLQGPYVFCFPEETPILMSDWTEKRIVDVCVGDEVVGYDFPKSSKSKLVRSKVKSVGSRVANVIEASFESGRIVRCTDDHKWYTGRRGTDVGGNDSHKAYLPLGFHKSALKALISVVDRRIFDLPYDLRCASYLGGMFDGDGSVSSGTIHFFQSKTKHPEVCEKIRECLVNLGFETTERDGPTSKSDGRMMDLYIRGGRQEKIRFMSMCRPVKNKTLSDTLFTYGTREFGKACRDKLVSIKNLGPQKVYNIETETGNYVAWGYAAKNSAQYLLNPVADRIMGFNLGWVQYASVTYEQAQRLNRYIIVDGASKQKKDSDYTAMWVVGVGHDGNYYVLDHIFDRLSLTQRWEALYGLHKKWKPLKVGYEEFSSNADREHFEFMMNHLNYRFTITPVTGGLSKPDRIRRLIPVFEQGRIFLPQSLIKTSYENKTIDVIRIFIEEEYTSFPVCAHFDQFDSLSRILDDELYVSLPSESEQVTPDAYGFHDIESQGIRDGDIGTGASDGWMVA